MTEEETFYESKKLKKSVESETMKEEKFNL